MTPVTTHDATAAPPPRPEVTAFVEVLRVHDRSLRALVWSVLRDRHAIDDVLQAAYEKQYDAVRAMMKSQDWIEGPLAFSEKRAPEWKGE